MKFHEIKGKTIQAIELFVSPDGDCIIDIGFQDKTSLSLIVEPCVVIKPVLADWKPANIDHSSGGGLFRADRLAHKRTFSMDA
ncbi:MAG: hypothetical protein LAO76_14685 [Acidobacteriia bacterium]|nr:hypothetical protein [Terriglobia bacterium]